MAFKKKDFFFHKSWIGLLQILGSLSCHADGGSIPPETPVPIEAARSRFEPWNWFLWDVTVLFKTNIKIFAVCVVKSTSVLLSLLIPVLGSPLSNRRCRCTGIVLQNGCQLTNRVTDVCGYALSTGSLRKYQGSEQAVSVCSGEHYVVLLQQKRLFSVTSIWRILSSPHTHTPWYSLWRGGSLVRPCKLCAEQGVIL